MEQLAISEERKLREFTRARQETTNVAFRSVSSLKGEQVGVVLARDVIAMANTGGGYIVVPDPPRTLTQATVQDQIAPYFNRRPQIHYAQGELRTTSEESELRRVGIVYVPASTGPVIAAKDGFAIVESGKAEPVFHEGDFFLRKGTESVKATEVPAEPTPAKARWTRTQDVEELALLVASFPNLAREVLKKLEQAGFHRTDADELVFAVEEDQRLTPSHLETNINPYLSAIADIQRIVDEIRGQEPREVSVIAIRQRSPVSVSLNGASDAVQLIKETVVPWRRKHAETMARLAEAEKRAEIEVKTAEIFERRARAKKDREEAERIAAEAAQLKADAERLRIQNRKLRLELHRARIQLALDLLTQLAPNLSEQQRISYVIQLLEPLKVLTESSLELSP